MSEWIKCSDRLPKNYELVLMLNLDQNTKYDVGYFDEMQKYWFCPRWSITISPTHWMPLPLPPKDEK